MKEGLYLVVVVGYRIFVMCVSVCVCVCVRIFR